jgi:hypothetical protein
MSTDRNPLDTMPTNRNSLDTVPTNRNPLDTVSTDQQSPDKYVAQDSSSRTCCEGCDEIYCLVHRKLTRRCGSHYTIIGTKRKSRCKECCEKLDEKERNESNKRKAIDHYDHYNIYNEYNEYKTCEEGEASKEIWCDVHKEYVIACYIHRRIKEKVKGTDTIYSLKYECYDCCKKKREKTI